MRIVGKDTTWVAKGTGYELAALSKTDIAIVQGSLDRAVRAFTDAFGAPPPSIVVALIDAPRDAKSSAKSTPVPSSRVPVVQVMVGEDPGARIGAPFGRGGESGEPGETGEQGRFGGGDDRLGGGGRGGAFAGGVRDIGNRELTRGPLRAWLSARASTLNGQPALGVQAAGVAPDPRVPSWAEDGIPALSLDSTAVFGLVGQLAANMGTLLPLDSLLTMRRPPDVFGQLAQGGGMGGDRGGMGGGRGGFGGGRGGYGGDRGGMGGRGAGARPNGSARVPLRGGALFTAESIAFAKYVAMRESPAFVGHILDAQMLGQPWKSALTGAASMPTNARDVEADWRHWLEYHGGHAAR